MGPCSSTQRGRCGAGRGWHNVGGAANRPRLWWAARCRLGQRGRSTPALVGSVARATPTPVGSTRADGQPRLWCRPTPSGVVDPVPAPPPAAAAGTAPSRRVVGPVHVLFLPQSLVKVPAIIPSSCLATHGDATGPRSDSGGGADMEPRSRGFCIYFLQIVVEC